jgi:energy-coupling factor transporter ATP-binding protein EcfA2
MLTWPVASLGWVSSLVQEAEASQKRINEFLKEEPEIKNTNSSHSTIEGDIKFDNVSFEYDDTNIKALDKISFEVKKGKTLAVLGKTGSGKSTLLTLISRLYDTLGNYMPLGANWGINPGVNSALYEDLPGAKIPASSFELSLLGWEAVDSTLLRKIAGGTLVADNVTHGQGYCRVTTDGTAIPFGIKTGKIYLNPDAGYYTSIAVRPVNSDSLGDYSLVVDYYDINDNVIVVYQDNLTNNKTTNSKDAAGDDNTVITTAARTQTATITLTDRWAYMGNSFPVSSITGAAYAILSITFNPTTSVSGQAFDIDRVVFRE